MPTLAKLSGDLTNRGKRNVAAARSVVGGVFNNADILRIDYSAEYNVESAEEQKDAHLLTLKAKTGEGLDAVLDAVAHGGGSRPCATASTSLYLRC